MALENAVVFGSFFLAVAVVAYRAVRIQGLDLTNRIRLPKWDFSKNWASTFTVFAAVISALVSSAANLVSKPPYFFSSSTSYATLAISFGLLVTLAPFLYRAMSAPRAAGPEPEYDGAVWLFLVCTALALWATLGQLATTTLFLLETQPVSVDRWSALVLAAPFILIGIAMVGYVYRAMKPILETPVRKDTDAPRASWDLF